VEDSRAISRQNEKLRSAARPEPFDRRCYQLVRSGKTVEYVAKIMNATEDEVEKGVLMVEAWQHSNSRDMVEAAVNEQAIEAISPIGRTLAEAQRAERVVPAVYDDKGNEIASEIRMPDFTTRIEAVKATATIISAVREKAPTVAINQQFNQNNMNGMGGMGKPMSFEARVREKQEQRQRLLAANNPVTVSVVATGSKADGADGDYDGDEDAGDEDDGDDEIVDVDVVDDIEDGEDDEELDEESEEALAESLEDESSS